MTLAGPNGGRAALGTARPASAPATPRRRASGAASQQPQPARRRRRRAEEPFHLVIVDHDNDRFTVEGPMTDPERWIREVLGARRSGREITCQVLAGGPEEVATSLARIAGTRWPSGLIVAPQEPIRAEPESETAPGPAPAFSPGPEQGLEVTWVGVLDALRALDGSDALKIEALDRRMAAAAPHPIPDPILAEAGTAPGQ
jgi:hypothetical protein